MADKEIPDIVIAQGGATKVAAGDVVHVFRGPNSRAATLEAQLPATPASSSGPASMQFHEDTDNGSHKVTLSAPASLAADVAVTLPSAAGTLATDPLTTRGDIIIRGASAPQRLAKGSQGQVLIMGADDPAWGSKGPDVILEDQKTQNTNGGTFTSGADRTRDLNTEVYDPSGYCTLSSNQFTLAAGTWVIEWSAPAGLVDAHQSFLYNATDATEIKRGSAEYAASANQAANRSVGCAVVTVAASKALEIRHRCTTTRANDGLGVRANFGVEVYTIVKAWKVA